MSEIQSENGGPDATAAAPVRRYILLAAALLIVIIIAIVLLVTWGIPALRSADQPTVAAQATSTITPVPTFTPGPTKAPTSTPPPSATPTRAAPEMEDTDAPIYDFESAGGRPGNEWTGFFGQVLDSSGQPLADVPVAIWYRDGRLASPITTTKEDGSYEIHLSDEAPLPGTWTIQLLTKDWQAASKLFTFQTDANIESGIQQIQVLWVKAP